MKFLSCWMFWYPFGIPFYSFSLLLMRIHEQFKRLGNKIRVLNLFLWHKKRRIFYCNYKKEKILTLLPSKTNRKCSTASPTDATTILFKLPTIFCSWFSGRWKIWLIVILGHMFATYVTNVRGGTVGDCISDW